MEKVTRENKNTVESKRKKKKDTKSKCNSNYDKKFYTTYFRVNCKQFSKFDFYLYFLKNIPLRDGTNSNKRDYTFLYFCFRIWHDYFVFDKILPGTLLVNKIIKTIGTIKIK